MDNDLKILENLPKIEASRSFEDMLFHDALGELENEEANHPRHLQFKPNLWMSFALAASLLIGAFIGVSGTNFTQSLMGGLGLSEIVASDAESLEFDSYSFSMDSLSS